MADNWKIGDVVTLKSGFDKFTINKILKDEVELTWFHDGKIVFMTVSPDAIKPYVEIQVPGPR